MSSKKFNITKKENQMIIAFSGPSTSGKSSLIDELLETQLQSKYDSIEVVAMERFFKQSYNAPKIEMGVNSLTNLYLKESIKWNSFFKHISKIDSPILFIDGFILFADERSHDIVDVCVSFEYNTETDFEIALDRRVHRYGMNKNIPIPKDYLEKATENRFNMHCAYFHEAVWPEMVRHPEYRTPQNWEKPLLILSATNDFHDNVNKAFNFLQPYILK